jgi:multiple sugar transport system permease protein
MPMTRTNVAEGAARAASSRPPRTRQRGVILLFVGPFVALFLFVFAAPIVYSAVESLYSRRASGLGLGGAKLTFVGLDNFRQVLTDTVFTRGVGRVFLFGVIQIPVMLIGALALALLLDSVAARGVSAFRAAFFLPYALPGSVAALLWAYLYIPQLSPYSAVLSRLGLQVQFLGPSTVLWAIANITTWTYTGYNMLIIYASLKAISPDLYEAARIDGAGEWSIALRIKVPAVRNALVLSGVLSIIGTLQLFTEPTILQSISTTVDINYTPTMFAFNAAFTSDDTGLASAASLVIAVMAGILSVIYYRVAQRDRSGNVR